MLTATLVEAPGLSAPLPADNATQVCDFAAVQLIATPPVFCSVYVWFVGVKGPPFVPEDVSPAAGDTDSIPGCGVTVSGTGRVALPPRLWLLRKKMKPG